MSSDDWRGDDISDHHEGLLYPVIQPLMSSSALSTHTGMWACVWGGVLNMSSDDWRGDDISDHHEGLEYPVIQPLMSSSALSTHTDMWVCVWGGVLNMSSDDWRGDDISLHHEGLNVYPAMQSLMSSSALSTHTDVSEDSEKVSTGTNYEHDIILIYMLLLAKHAYYVTCKTQCQCFTLFIASLF